MISTGLSSGFSTLLLKASSLSFHSRNCSVACSIRVAADCLSIISFHFSVTSSSSGFSKSITSSGFGGLTGNILMKLWLAAINKSTAKGSNTTMMISITHLTASEVLTFSVIPKSTASAAMYLTGPTSASNWSIWLCRGSRSTISASILFCAARMLLSALVMSAVTPELSVTLLCLNVSIRFCMFAVLWA